jgi:hypothetical protein
MSTWHNYRVLIICQADHTFVRVIIFVVASTLRHWVLNTKDFLKDENIRPVDEPLLQSLELQRVGGFVITENSISNDILVAVGLGRSRFDGYDDGEVVLRIVEDGHFLILFHVEFELLMVLYLLFEAAFKVDDVGFGEGGVDDEVHWNSLRITYLLSAEVYSNFAFFLGIIFEVQVVDALILLILH